MGCTTAEQDPSFGEPRDFRQSTSTTRWQAAHGSARQRNNPDFPLRNFVRCGCCDRPLTASWSTGRNSRYAYYRCQNRTCKSVNLRREDMERLFIDFLGQLQPKSEYLRLFGEIIFDVWKQKQEQATVLHEAALRNVRELQERKQRLVEAFVYKRQIGRVTYQEQLDKLNEEIALSEIEERDTRIDELDVQAAISHGEFLLLNAPRLWMESSLEQKQRLQEVFRSEIEERDTRIDELDVQAAISHGEFLLLNAPRLWMESSLEQKQRLQEVF